MNCFYIYVLPLLKAQLGHRDCHLPSGVAFAAADIDNKSGKTLFLKGMVDNEQATLLSGQASSMLKSFAVCNAILVIPSHVTFIKKGEKITYLKL